MFDSLTVHAQTHFARAVVAWCASSPEPPPLNLLQIPYRISVVVEFLHDMLRQRIAVRRLGGGGRQQATSSVGSRQQAAGSVGSRQQPPASAPPFELNLATPSAPPSPPSPVASAANASGNTQGVGGSPADADCGSVPRRGKLLSDGLGHFLRHTHDTFSGMDLQPAVQWLLFADGAAAQLDVPGGTQRHEYAGTTVRSVLGAQNSWEIWKEKMTITELAHEVRYSSLGQYDVQFLVMYVTARASWRTRGPFTVTAVPALPRTTPHYPARLPHASQISSFIAKHEDTLVQEERWRNKMMRRLGDKFDHIESRLDSMDGRFEQLTLACIQIKDSVRSLDGQLPPATSAAVAEGTQSSAGVTAAS